MIQFKRDEVGKPPRLHSKKVSDGMWTFLEALGNATFSPPNAGELISTENNVIIKINPDAFNAPPCFLGLFDASDEDGVKIGVTWGTINGQQPTGFSAGGTPPFTIPVAGAGWVFARADFDLTAQQTTATSIVVMGTPTVANTATTAYQLVGSFSQVTVDEVTTLAVVSTCGNVDIDICSLLANSASTGGTGGGSSPLGDGADGSGDEGGTGPLGGPPSSSDLSTGDLGGAPSSGDLSTGSL